MKQRVPISEADLQAYVDGRLDAKCRHAVEVWLADHPGDASRVAAYRLLAEQCRAAYAQALEEPVPPALLCALKPRRRIARRLGAGLAAAVAVLVVAIGAWEIGARFSSIGEGTEIVERASMAHAVYSGAPSALAVHGDQAPVLAWLSAGLGMDLQAPDLTAAGFSFVGGELLPGRAQAAAIVLYKGRGGQHVSLYWGPEFRQEQGTGLRYAGSASGARVYYWLDDDCGYAIASRELTEKELLRVAFMAYAQLEK